MHISSPPELCGPEQVTPYLEASVSSSIKWGVDMTPEGCGTFRAGATRAGGWSLGERSRLSCLLGIAPRVLGHLWVPCPTWPGAAGTLSGTQGPCRPGAGLLRRGPAPRCEALFDHFLMKSMFASRLKLHCQHLIITCQTSVSPDCGFNFHTGLQKFPAFYLTSPL